MADYQMDPLRDFDFKLLRNEFKNNLIDISNEICEVYGDEYELGVKKRFGHSEEFKKIAGKLILFY